MGALASLDQREEVRKAIQSLRASAELVHGDPDHRRPGWSTVTPSAARSSGRCSCARTRGAVEPHDVEPFGPVSTVLTYDSLDEAVELAARGKGSLVASVVTHDPEVARSLVLGIAPWHGRVHVLDRDDAAESTGHGSPLPTLVHGGPGRAGGGEELGGVRAVLGHMQRTAVQASPDLMTAITGRWTTGSARHEDGTHPFRKSLADLRIGDTDRVGVAPGHAAPTSTTSPSSPATRSTRTPTRRRPPRTRCSAASSRTATSSSRWPPACSSTPTPVRCWPTSASTTSAS